MKSVRLGPGDIFYRYLTPKWSFAPLSGAGASIDGGRFNRPGVEALYLSRAPQTALEEYRQGATIAPPATLAAYKVTLDKIADFSAGYDPDIWTMEWAEWNCNWRKTARIDKKTPPSWRLSDSLVVAGFQGMLFPSLKHAGGTNLVVFNANLTGMNAILTYDPHNDLPRDQSSWEPGA